MTGDASAPEAGLRVLIAGGGTGGHLFPGVALAEEVRARGGEVLFVGTARGIEARVLPEEGWPLELVTVRGLKGRGVRGLLDALLLLPRAWAESRGILRRFRPDVVVGVGGYASGPVVATAALQGRPTAILEQNSVPGLTNRVLARVVRAVFCAFPDVRGRFPATKVVPTGNPIRRALVERLGAATAGAAGGSDGAIRLLVFGGSQGARALNDAMIGVAPLLPQRFPGLRVVHQTGTADEERVRTAYAAAGLGDAAVVRPFIRDMAAAYAAADLVLCRAGATSLGELAVVGLPALLVPFPQATDDHQTWNARALVDAGAARLLPQAELAPERLLAELAAVADPETRSRMAAAMRAAARPAAAATVYEELVRLASRAV
jgi:UDP-N-acetylglucosamine--N-acetylmuramyl-(pentapeptide) pyrophosphoryl-undecaprenol N-acetylglucosamine transferase